MTLILTVASPDYVILVGDRRLSAEGALVDDETTKVGVLDAGDATLLWAYTGLARCGGFVARKWIGDALMKVGPPDFTFGSMLQRLAVEATETFARRNDFRRTPNLDKRFTMVFAGFDSDRHATVSIVSNFEHLNGDIETKARDYFTFEAWRTTANTAVNGSVVMAHGATQTLADATLPEVNALLVSGKPATVVRDKCVDVIRSLADDPRALNSIGRQLLGAILPASTDFRRPVATTFYRSAGQFIELPGIEHVAATPHGSARVSDLVITIGEREVRTPTAPRNARCPCGSGKKFKHCHGN